MSAYLETLPLSELVKIYNTHAASPVKSFRDKATAVSRVMAVLPAEELEAEPDYADEGDNPVDPLEDTEDSSSFQEDANSELPTADAGWAMPSKKTAAPAARKRSTTKRDRPEYAVPTGRSLHSEEDTIQVLVDHNPKRTGSATHARFGFYENGMTVKEFLDLCEATGHFAHRHLYRADLRWDEKQGFIKIVPAVKN